MGMYDALLNAIAGGGVHDVQNRGKHVVISINKVTLLLL